VKIYDDLDRSGQMAIRQHWGWGWMDRLLLPEPFVKNFVNAMTNRGSDYFWFGGFSNGGGEDGAACTTAQALQANIPQRNCNLDPSGEAYKVLYQYIKNGGRYAAHTVGDKDIDNLMDIIEKASQEAGMTEEQIRAKRHGFDHGVMAPRPDQINRIKKLGLIASGNAPEIWQASPAIFQYYGETVAGWVVPKKRLVDAQIINTFESDRAIGTTDFTAFTLLSWMVTRKAWDGKVYAPDQKIGREVALKSATTWGTYYVLRENVLGSLEPGKWADFVVIDRDYLTIPENDLENIRTLMTVVGGRVVHLVPSLARESGMQPTGAQVTLGFHPAQW
jgi:predicted amidohydrolase YtcJ